VSFLAPAGALLLLAGPAIVLLYFLKVRRPEVAVSTLMFWRPFVTDRQADAPWQRLRRSLLLLAQILTAAGLAIALMRPGLTGAAGVDSMTVVMIDASPSMAATDVQPTRFAAALDRAGRLADQMAPGQLMAVILAGPRAQLLVSPTGDPAAVRAGLARARVAGAAGDFGEAASLAGSVLAGHPRASLVVIGDGHMRPPPSPPRVAAPMTYYQVGVSGENAGVEALSRSPSGSVFVRLANHGHAARDARVEMRADGRLVDVLPVHLEGDSASDLTWDRLPASTQVLEARLTPADAFSLDDSAWLVTGAPPPHGVLLVTNGNGFLQRALVLRPGVDVTVVQPRDYRPGSHDLTVFDGFLPPAFGPGPALIVNPPGGQGLAPSGPPADAGALLPSNPREPLLRDVSLGDVHVETAQAVKPPADWRPVVSAAVGPLLLARDEPRAAELTFDLHHSDLPLRAAFPILVQNLLDYLLPDSFENQVYPPGQSVALASEAGVTRIEVTGPDGAIRRLSPPFSPFADTAEPGVYTVRQLTGRGTRESRFVIQLMDPAISRIAPGPAPLMLESESPPGPAPRGTLEIWPWFAVGLLGLLGLEWVLYLRGRIG
jgi:predicted regulator of Ras-like GTPase activity (Roadblock/LC7/MglB family)